MTAAVVTRELTKTYHLGHGKVPALRGVSLSVEMGEFVAISGPSGSGKSTLLHIMAGLDLPDSGSVVVDGQEIDFADPRQRATMLGTRIGFVFQSFNLVPVLSAVENVEFPLWAKPYTARKRREKAAAMLEKVGLGDRLHHRPADMSGGQQQRVAVARALVGEPAVVFADEPTANLDGATAEALLDTMRDINQRMGTTFIFSTHDHRVMRFAQRLITIEDGALLP